MKNTVTTTRFFQLFCMLLLCVLNMGARAQTPNPSFVAIGHIESFSLITPSNPLTSATMTVRGQTITIPSSLLVVMPGQYLTAHDIFRWNLSANAYAATPLAQSGLALRDVPAPAVPFEADIIGNIVNGVYIAGVVRISQGALHVTAGFIQSMNPATGDMTVGPLGGSAGVRVHLNDPKGIYGPPSTTLDARFSLDPDNSPVHAKTGFPVCTPRTDDPAKCPAANRPADPALRFRFTCGPGIPASVDAPTVASCNPSLPMPLAVGDYITVVGMLARDSAGQFFVSAHGLGAELGVYTAQGVDPAYVFIEDALQGTKGESFAGIPQEETTRFRIVGFTTDPSRNVEVSMVDSGLDEVGTSLSGPGGLFPSNLAQLGRFRNTWPSKDNARAVRRDVRAKIVGLSPAKLPNGLTPGLYTAPIGEYIFPENTRFGVGSFPIPVSFENFCFLRTPGAAVTTVDARVLTALDPFPASGHPVSQTAGSAGARVCATIDLP